MKGYNKYFYESSMWIIFFSGWFILGLITFVMFQCFAVSENLAPFTTLVNIKIGLAFGFICSILWTLTVSMQRSNKKFWDECEELDYDIRDCKTKETLKFVYQTKFVPLSKRSFGEHHVGELKRLYAIIETKFQYLPE